MGSTLEDLGIKFASTKKPTDLYSNDAYGDMDIDSKGSMVGKTQEHREHLVKTNKLMTLEIVEKITLDKKNKVFLPLIHFNMPTKFNNLLERVQILDVHWSTSQGLMPMNHIIVILASNIREAVNEEYKLDKHRFLGILDDAKFGGPTSYYRLGVDRSVSWIALDILMEDAMDGRASSCHLLKFLQVHCSKRLDNNIARF